MPRSNKISGLPETRKLRKKLRKKREKSIANKFASAQGVGKPVKGSIKIIKKNKREEGHNKLQGILRKGPDTREKSPYKDRLTRDYESFKREESKYNAQTSVSRKKGLVYANKRDEQEIAELSSMLRIRDVNKNPRAFCMDGLDDLLDICRETAAREVQDIGTAWMDTEEIDESTIPRKIAKSVVKSKEKVPGAERKSKRKVVTFAEEPEVLETKSEQSIATSKSAENKKSESIFGTGRTAASTSDANKLPEDGTEDKELSKKLRALFNRLSCGNLSWAMKEFQAIHNSSEYSRHQVKSHLWTALEQAALRSNVPDNMLLEHAGFMALINSDIDEQWGAFLMNRLIHCENRLMCVRLAAALASLKVISTQLLADMIGSNVERKVLSAEDLADMCFSAHRLFSPVRKNDVYRSSVQILSAADELSTRSKVLLGECLRKRKEGDNASIIKVVQNLCSRPLAAATVTSTFAELQSGYLTAQFGHSTERREPSRLSGQVVEPVARKLRMNTGVRSTILSTVLQSEDHMDATGRLLQLKLTKIQRREIINVLMVMMLKEKSFNAFYPMVIEKLCRVNKLFAQTTKQRTWDNLKEPPKRPTILADFIVHQLKSQTFNLSFLKAVPFVTMDTVQMNLVRNVLLRFFDQVQEQLVIAQVIALVKDPKLTELCKSLRLFVQKFINNRKVMEQQASDTEKIAALVNKVMMLLKTVDCS